MCGTASRSITPDQIVSALNVKHVHASLPPVYNIKPSTPVVILRPDARGDRIMDVAHWWLTPGWVADRIEFRPGKEGTKSIKWLGKPLSLFNIRFDTVTDPRKPYWRKLLSSQRCAMVVDAFVEWPDDALRDKSRDKVPALFYYQDRRPFGLLGFWEAIQDDEGKDFLSCTVVTVEPNDLLKGLPHHRMPAMGRDGDLDRWLDPRLTSPEEAAGLLRTTPAEAMGAHLLSKDINAGRNNYPEMLAPTGRYGA